jgi:predicted nucleic acid-binding protein
VYILDTCILNILFHDSPSAQKNLKAKLETVDDQDIWVSVVTIHELLVEGIAPAIHKRLNSPKAVLAFNALVKFLDDISEYQILPYTDEDDAYFHSNIPAKIKRKGPLDCRIASSAVNNDFVVVTRNTTDFDGTGAKCEDWTVSVPQGS